MQRLYDSRWKRLIYIDENASPEFWDRQWREAVMPEKASHGASAKDCVEAVRRNIGSTGRVLEAGCGNGGPLLALHRNGYDVVGLDFAPETIRMLQTNHPELSVVLGDVRALDFGDDTFDGYFSGGVIEHFWDGYNPILNECYRVIKPGGSAVFTFPSMTLLRRIKARIGLYKSFDNKNGEPEGFYQFALPPEKVAKDLRSLGFDIIAMRARSGVKGAADEVPWLEGVLRGKNSLAARIARRLVRVLEPWCGHGTLIIARKPHDGRS